MSAARPRLLVVSAHFPPDFVSGGTLVPDRQARGLAAHGWDVSVYAGSLDPARPPLHRRGPVPQGGDHPGPDGDDVLGDVALRQPELREVHLVGARQAHRTPVDLQPRSTIGFWDRPLMNSHARTPGPFHGCPYIAVGMQSAVASSIGLPSIATSASRMLALVTPPEVRRSFTVLPTLDRRETHRSSTQPIVHDELSGSQSLPSSLRSSYPRRASGS